MAWGQRRGVSDADSSQPLSFSAERTDTARGRLLVVSRLSHDRHHRQTAACLENSNKQPGDRPCHSGNPKTGCGRSEWGVKIKTSHVCQS